MDAEIRISNQDGICSLDFSGDARPETERKTTMSKIFNLDLASSRKPLPHYWEFCVGSCHAATALRQDWRQMLEQCHKELGFRYLRFHGLFDDDMSVVLKNLFTRQITLSFSNIDKIFDYLLSIGMRPFVELSFMPEAFASGNKTLFHYKCNTTPPADYAQWKWFIQEFISHILKRYGREEVRQWYFEIWNEPNLGGKDSPYGFWSGTKEEYFKLYQVTAGAVKEMDRALRVGGPATSNNAWIPEFLEFCKESGAPVDFVTTHQYPTDVVLGYGVEDSANFNNPFDTSRPEKIAETIRIAKEDPKRYQEILQEYSVFQSHLWEKVDRGVLTDMARRAKSEAGELPLYYTEWGSLAGLESDGAFGASFIPKTVFDSREYVEGCSFWTFCDIVEESGQNSQVFHGGFGLMTQQGIPKAPYRAFQLLHKLGDEVYDAKLAEGTVDGWAVAKPEAGAVQFMLVNHHSLLHPIEEETVELVLKGGDCLEAEFQCIDQEHANALEGWKSMGSPEYLDKGQEYQLLAASQLKREPLALERKDGETRIRIQLSKMATVLVTVYLK